jgi:hypothetical protein
MSAVLVDGLLDDVDPTEVVFVLGRARRSGMLSLAGPAGRGEITFDAGAVVRVRLFEHTETVAALLVRMSLAPSTLLHASRPDETLDQALARVTPASMERIEALMVDQLLATASRMLTWRKGTFSFVEAATGRSLSRFLNDVAITITHPLSADAVVREAKSRRERRGRDPLASHVAQQAPSPSLRPRVEPADLFILDNDPLFLAACGSLLRDAGVAATMLSSARAGVERLPELVSHPNRIMLVNLTMPRSNGRGLLGGLEVLRRAAATGVAHQLVLMSDHPHDDAMAIAQVLGVGGQANKPHGRDNDSLGALLNPWLLRLGRPALPLLSFDLGKELSTEQGLAWRESAASTERPLDTLRSLLHELNQPTFDEGIPLLILRFVSHFFQRGALFKLFASTQELVGLGAFGVAGDDPGRTIRTVRIPTNADGYFAQALAQRTSLQVSHFSSEWNSRLLQALGGPEPINVFVAPLYSQRGLEGMLYADQLGEQREFPDVTMLEIFLQQAAMALERMELQRAYDKLSTPPHSSEAVR